jgi:hypothetical protein
MSSKKQRQEDNDSAEVSVLAVVLCDQIRQEMNGKFLFIGVYNDVIQVPQFPFTISFAVAVLTRVVKPGPLSFTVQFQEVAGKTLLQSVTGEGRYEGQEGRQVWLPVPIPPLQVQREGDYQIVLDFAGSAKTTERYTIQRAGSQAQIATTANPSPN